MAALPPFSSSSTPVPAPTPASATTTTTTTTRTTFDIGTRKSALALAQTELVVSSLTRAWPDHTFQIHARDTAAGDLDKVTPFKDMPVKNLWTHELETLLMEGKLDLLVHSLKDVPTQMPPSCVISGVLPRADPRDVLVLKANRPRCQITDLPAGAVVGTSSIRRTAQVALRHPHLRVQDLRGNVPTRLRKLDADDSPFDAIIIAAAGLLRLDLGHRITQYLDSSSGGMLYAVGQGAIGLEARTDDVEMRRLLESIVDRRATLACTAERSLLRTLEGGCSAPLGVETSWLPPPGDDDTLQMKALVVSVDGTESVGLEMQVVGLRTAAQAERFGEDVAAELLRKGAGRILEAIQAKKMTRPIDLEEK